jgi:hypothetical protein
VARVGGPDDGAHARYTIQVDDSDATCAELTPRGAAFADPAGHGREVAQAIAR